jgi:hypothetical protein
MLGFERRWAIKVLEGFAPVEGPGLAPAEGEVDYLEAMLTMTRASTRVAALGFRIALWITVFSPVFVLGKLRLLPSLDRTARSELLVRLLGHRIFLVRELCLLMKMCACMAIFRVPSLRVRSQYDAQSEEDGEAFRSGPQPVRLRLRANDREEEVA